MFALILNFKQFYLTNRTLSGVTTLDQNRPGSNGNEGVLCIPQSSSITGLFRVISKTLVGDGVGFLLCRDAVDVFYSPSRLSFLHGWIYETVIFLIVVDLFFLNYIKFSPQLFISPFFRYESFFMYKYFFMYESSTTEQNSQCGRGVYGHASLEGTQLIWSLSKPQVVSAPERTYEQFAPYCCNGHSIEGVAGTDWSHWKMVSTAVK